MPWVAWAWEKILLLSTADHPPSTPWATLATTRWEWRWGSRARLVRCTNSPATAPVVGRKEVTPRCLRRTPNARPLQIVHGLGHRGAVAGTDCTGDLPGCEKVQQTDRLRGAEGEVVPRHAVMAP